MNVLDLVLLGLAISVDPLPITTFFVLLAAKKGTVKGAAFLAGWILSLIVVVVVTLTATGNKPPKPNTAPSLAAVAVKMAIGAVLIVVAIRQRRRMGQPKKPKKTPKWQQGVDNMSPLFAAGLAVFAQPWALLATGAATISEAKVSGPAERGGGRGVLPAGDGVVPHASSCCSCSDPSAVPRSSPACAPGWTPTPTR